MAPPLLVRHLGKTARKIPTLLRKVLKLKIRKMPISLMTIYWRWRSLNQMQTSLLPGEGDHPARIDKKTDLSEENQERETTDLGLGKKAAPATRALQGTDILIITEKIEDILQYPRPPQHPELITEI